MLQEEMKPYTSYKINKKKVDGRVLGFVIVMRDTKNNLYQLVDIKQKNQQFVVRKSFEKGYNMSVATEDDLMEFAKAKRKIKNSLRKA